MKTKGRFWAILAGIVSIFCVCALAVGCSDGKSAQLQESYYKDAGTMTQRLDLFDDQTYILHTTIMPIVDENPYMKVEVTLVGKYEVVSEDMSDFGVDSGKQVKLSESQNLFMSAKAYGYGNIAEAYKDVLGKWTNTLTEEQAKDLLTKFGIKAEGTEYKSTSMGADGTVTEEMKTAEATVVALDSTDYSIIDEKGVSTLPDTVTYLSVFQF